MTNERKNTVLLFVGGLLLCVIAMFTAFSEKERTLINWITVFGTFISIFGLVVAYLQISSVKRIAQLTEKKVQETKERINLILSVSDISKAIKVAEEAQSFLGAKNYPSALLRFKDLKSIIIQATYISELSSLVSTQEYQTLKSNIFDDIVSLSDFIYKHKRNINFSRINSNLEKTSSVLIEFENQLKK